MRAWTSSWHYFAYCIHRLLIQLECLFSTETPPNFNTGTSFLRHIQRENHQTRDPLFGFPSLWQSPASRAAPSAPASPQLLLAQIYNREMEAPKLAS